MLRDARTAFVRSLHCKLVADCPLFDIFILETIAFIFSCVDVSVFFLSFLVVLPPTSPPTPITPRPECRRDDECPDDKACFDSTCQDPCAVRSPCGVNAQCKTQNHLPVCTCLPGYRGNPILQCVKGRIS